VNLTFNLNQQIQLNYRIPRSGWEGIRFESTSYKKKLLIELAFGEYFD
jgi:hypothetical protein